LKPAKNDVNEIPSTPSDKKWTDENGRKNETSTENATGVQGEGDYKAAREFDEAERNFVASGKVPAAARAAAPISEAEQREMLEAEEAGKRRARK
jgi:hypothetical protein